MPNGQGPPALLMAAGSDEDMLWDSAVKEEDDSELKEGHGRCKSKAKAKAKGKSPLEKPTAKPTSRVRPDRTCLARCCDKPRYSGHRWCKDHRRSVESMKFQAQAAEARGEQGAVEAFERAFQTDETAAEAIEAFCELNPPEAKWTRKNFIDWAQFVSKHGKRSSVIDQAKTKPMAEGEFLLWMKNQKD